MQIQHDKEEEQVGIATFICTGRGGNTQEIAFGEVACGGWCLFLNEMVYMSGYITYGLPFSIRINTMLEILRIMLST